MATITHPLGASTSFEEHARVSKDTNMARAVRVLTRHFFACAALALTGRRTAINLLLQRAQGFILILLHTLCPLATSLSYVQQRGWLVVGSRRYNTRVDRYRGLTRAI